MTVWVSPPAEKVRVPPEPRFWAAVNRPFLSTVPTFPWTLTAVLLKSKVAFRPQYVPDTVS